MVFCSLIGPWGGEDITRWWWERQVMHGAVSSGLYGQDYVTLRNNQEEVAWTVCMYVCLTNVNVWGSYYIYYGFSLAGSFAGEWLGSPTASSELQ